MNDNDLMRQVAAQLFVDRMKRGDDELRTVQKIAEGAFDDAMTFVQESLEWWEFPASIKLNAGQPLGARHSAPIDMTGDAK